MFHKWTVACLVFLFIISITNKNLHAMTALEDVQDDTKHLLLVYSNNKTTGNVNVRKLEMLLHHFSDQVHIVSDDDVTQDDFNAATHIFYYGEEKKTIHESVRRLLQEDSKPIVFMGENWEQISLRSSFQALDTIQINQIQAVTEKEQALFLEQPLTVIRLEETKETDTLLYGYNGSTSVPLIVQSDNRYVITADMTDGLAYNYLAEVLHDIVPNNHSNQHVAYLRLEDIHPMSDPDKLLEVGNYLNERNIPYLLVVIPVYITPETGERVYFSDAPELVDVLHYLQDTGGTVIAHGYTHQYRDSETGEGFEFWDVKNNQFITSTDPKEEIEKIQSKEQLTNKEDYTAYLQTLKVKEKNYIDRRMEKSIHELVSHELFPLAFEAPHYTMSQQGYAITANYFSAIFGQVQLSDENWQVMDAPPFVTSAHFLQEMTLFPETIGYVDTTLRQPLLETEKQIEETLIVRDSMIGGFYHTYLGLEYLPDLLALYEEVPHLTWLDLKKMTNTVRTSNVQITSSYSDIQVENDLAWWSTFFDKNDLSLFEKVLWGVTVIVCIFVLLFFFFTLYLRAQLKKRLFKERKHIG